MSNDIDLATALFGNKRLENGTSESVKIMTGTAVSDSSDGKVKVVIDGVTTGEEYDGELQDNVIELDTSPNVMKGDVVQITCYGGISKNMMVTSVLNSGDRTQDTADLAQYCADEAARFATDFIEKNGETIVLTNLSKEIPTRSLAALILTTEDARISVQGASEAISLEGHTHTSADFETVLFNNESQEFDANVTLNSTCVGYTYLDVYAITSDGIYISQRVYNPAINRAFDLSVVHGTSPYAWAKFKRFVITSATSIQNDVGGEWQFHNSAFNAGEFIKIIRVVGIK